MSPRERAAFAALTDAVVAPQPPLPPVHQTDATQAFEHWLEAAPPINRIALRATLLALAAARFGRRSRAARVRALHRVRRFGLVEAVRAAAGLCYYGDPRVARLLGYDP